MADSSIFIKTKLTGRRFEDHTVPLDILEDFGAFQNLVLDLAKSIYLEENRDKKRVPNGFSDDFTLKLASIEEGSSILKILLPLALSTANSAHTDYFIKARDRVVASVSAAANGRSIGGAIPDSLLPYFNKIGRRLKEDESIDFNPDQPDLNAKLNNASRARLVRESSNVEEVTQSIRIIGKIPLVDKSRNQYAIELEDNSRITNAWTPQYRDIINEAFENFDEGTRVSITGVGRLNRQNKLVSFDNIDDLSILDPLDVDLRIREIAQMQNGWLGGDESIPSTEALFWFANHFNHNFNRALPKPYIFPTAAGGIRLEWRHNGYDISIDVDLEAQAAYLHNYNIANDTEEEHDLNLNTKTDWDIINTSLEATIPTA